MDPDQTAPSKFILFAFPLEVSIHMIHMWIYRGYIKAKHQSVASTLRVCVHIWEQHLKIFVPACSKKVCHTQTICFLFKLFTCAVIELFLECGVLQVKVVRVLIGINRQTL